MRMVMQIKVMMVSISGQGMNPKWIDNGIQSFRHLLKRHIGLDSFVMFYHTFKGKQKKKKNYCGFTLSCNERYKRNLFYNKTNGDSCFVSGVIAVVI